MMSNDSSTMANRREWAMSDDGISVTLTAKEKTGRYYNEATIQSLVAACDGALFWDDHQNLHILRTYREIENDRICLLLSIEDDGVTVVNQTSDHYDWGEMEHIHPPVGLVWGEP